MSPSRKGFQRHTLALAVLLALAGAAQAQLSTATVQGQISRAGAAAQAGLAVVAVNQANGNRFRTTTRSDGSYVLAALPPGAYEIQVEGQKTQVVTLQVGETASVDLALGATGQQVTIVGSLQRKDVRSSEVGTSVSRKQIETLPQVTRNFLTFADLAPGVSFNVDQGSGQVKLQNGAQNQDNVNVFIDGVGQKNYILRGGISGLDSTRGNAFPQSAIAEYKVITQNYKAEFDQVSSAAITAITKSGTNEFHGDVFFDRTGAAWTAKDPFEKKNEAAGVKRPDTSQKQYGFSLGGPIKQDTLHFFVAYDGKDIGEPRQVVAQRTDLLPLAAGIVPSLIAQQGAATSSFRENLLLAKLDAQLGDDQKLTLSLRSRDESDYVPEDKKLSVPGQALNRKNKETRLTLSHELTRGDFVNEARLGYEDYTWNPRSDSTDALVKYKASPTNKLNNQFDVLFTGGSPNAQRRQQKGVFVSNDLTFIGMARHTLKGGAKVKDLTFDLSGTARAVDIVETIIDNTTGLPYYDGSLCTGTNIVNGGLGSDQCKIDRAIAPVGVRFKNQQLGLYLQDDWKLSKQLELNLGLRWDYETNALNDSYKTPADRVNAIYALDVTRWNIAPPAGQTYAQSLAKGGINIGDYIATGNRKAFTGAWQPRLGLSFDVTGDRSTVVFGGWGRAYDRAMANHALDELQKNAQPGGEIWLIKNDHKMPFTDQFSLGLRQAVVNWNTEVGVTRSHAKNQFNWFGGNRDANGGYATQSSIDPLWGGPDGYGTLILGDFISQAKTDSLYLKAEKPYTADSGWAAAVTYTYSDAKTTNRQWTNDIFNWTYGKSTAGWNPSIDVDRHRLVATGLTDKLLPWGISLAGKVSYGSGKPRQLTDCSLGFNNCVYRAGDRADFKQFDLSLAKDISLPWGRLTLRADVLNLFNTINYGGYDDWVGGPGNPQNALGGDNANLNTPNSRGGPMRTYKLGVAFKW